MSENLKQESVIFILLKLIDLWGLVCWVFFKQPLKVSFLEALNFFCYSVPFWDWYAVLMSDKCVGFCRFLQNLTQRVKSGGENFWLSFNCSVTSDHLWKADMSHERRYFIVISTFGNCQFYFHKPLLSYVSVTTLCFWNTFLLSSLQIRRSRTHFLVVMLIF